MACHALHTDLLSHHKRAQISKLLADCKCQCSALRVIGRAGKLRTSNVKQSGGNKDLIRTAIIGPAAIVLPRR